MDVIWKSIILATAGLFLLRLAGRKTISQLTIPTTVVMISIGSIIVQPIVEKSVWKTIIAAGIFILLLILNEFLSLKFNFYEKLIVGEAVTLIEDGQTINENLRKVRLTVDKLEIRLRQKGIKKITDVKTATLEPNGQIGYELFYDAQPLTIGEFKKMMNFLGPQIQAASPTPEFTIFDEVRIKNHNYQPPDKLQ
ncbi:DUF421 domain-containing protein [Desulfotomaculum defluvii]